MINRRSFFSGLVAGIVGYLGFNKSGTLFNEILCEDNNKDKSNGVLCSLALRSSSLERRIEFDNELVKHIVIKGNCQFNKTVLNYADLSYSEQYKELMGWISSWEDLEPNFIKYMSEYHIDLYGTNVNFIFKYREA